MEVKIEGQVLVIRIGMSANPPPSASGKTLLVSSTHGNVTTQAVVNGKPLVVSVNAYIRAH